MLCRAAHLALDSRATLKPLTSLALLRLALKWIHIATGDPGAGEELEGGEEEGGEEEGDGDVLKGGVDEVVGESMRLVRRLTLAGDKPCLPSYCLLDEVGLLNQTGFDTRLRLRVILTSP